MYRGRSNKKSGINLLIVGGMSMVASIVTPDLWRNWSAVLNNQSQFILQRTVETMRPILNDTAVLPFTLMLILTTFLFFLNRRSLKAGHVFLLAGIGNLALTFARNIPLFAIACVPILAELSANQLAQFQKWIHIEKKFSGFHSTSGISVWPLIIVVVSVVYFADFNFKNGKSINQFNPAVFPVQAADWIDTHQPSGKMFNEFNWGGYLLYRNWPNDKVFIDSQSDFYGEEFTREYDQILNAEKDWQNPLHKYDISWVIIPASSPLAIEISQNDEWTVLYSDHIALIGERK
jgi:hypothetical protein